MPTWAAKGAKLGMLKGRTTIVRTRLTLRWVVTCLACCSLLPAVLAVELFGPARVEVQVGIDPRSVVVADLDGDGILDLAVANRSSNSVSILLGDGLGGFSSAPDIRVGSFPRSVAVGDFNADGTPDLAVANSVGSNSVSILLGDGLGGFSSTPAIGVGSSPVSVAVGEFNADGAVDLAVANRDSDSVSILLGDGLGGFECRRPRRLAWGTLSWLRCRGASSTTTRDGGPCRWPTGASDTVSILLGDGLRGLFVGPDRCRRGGRSPVSVAVGRVRRRRRTRISRWSPPGAMTP